MTQHLEPETGEANLRWMEKEAARCIFTFHVAFLLST